MYCMKCGRETVETQVFCDSCLEIMQHYPVKPGTVISLPQRSAPVQEKKTAAYRKEPTVPEQMIQLRGMIRWLTAIIAILSVLLCATAAMLIHTLDRQSTSRTIGQNYTTVGSDTQP